MEGLETASRRWDECIITDWNCWDDISDKVGLLAFRYSAWAWAAALQTSWNEDPYIPLGCK